MTSRLTGPGRSRAGRCALAAALLLAVAACSNTRGSTAPTDPAVPVTARRTTASRPLTDDETLSIWATAHHDDLIDVTTDLASTMTDISADATAVDVASLRTDCRRLQAAVDRARLSPITRDRNAPDLWAQIIDDADTAAGACVRGDYDLTSSAMGDLASDSEALADRVEGLG